MPSRLDTYKGIMSWVNDTFVPLGMKAVEDLPKAIPGCGESCVIAKAIADGFGDKIEGVHVGLSSVTLDFKDWESHHEVENPQDVGTFILAFDDLKFPDLIDVDKTFAKVSDFTYRNRISEALDNYDDGKGVTAWYEDIPEQYSGSYEQHLVDMQSIKKEPKGND